MLVAMSRQAEQVDETISKFIPPHVLPALLNNHAALLNKVPPSDHPYPITPHYYLSEMALEQDVQVLVTQRDFDLALSQLQPSVTESEMQHYAYIQKLFSSDTSSGAHADVE